MNEPLPKKYFKIWQQNIAKSSTAQHDLLAKANPNDWDIIALQEPYLDHLGLTRANSHWTVIYPSNKNLNNQNRARSVLLINAKIDSSQVQQIKILSSDITVMILGIFCYFLQVIRYFYLFSPSFYEGSED